MIEIDILIKKCYHYILKEVIAMTSKEILHAIVGSEHQARLDYEQALEKVNGYDEYMAGESEKLRKAAFSEADEKLAQLEAGEIAAADAKISEMDERQKQELESANRWYLNNREGFIDRVFDMVVNSDV